MARRKIKTAEPAEIGDARARFFELITAQFDVLEQGYDDQTERAEWARISDEIKNLGQWWQ